MRLYTIGHSNRSFDEFHALLLEHRIDLVMDIRAFPGSRRLPQFGRDEFPAALDDVDVAYAHERELGGRRRAPAEPTGCGDAWRNASFRAYAEYTRTAEYAEALGRLIDRAHQTRIAIMCSEAVPWRCHRWLVSDTLVARGVEVAHIVGPGSAKQHLVSPFAHVEGETVTWPGPPSPLTLKLGPALEPDD